MFKSLPTQYWVICMLFSSSADFFLSQLFRKILSGIPSGVSNNLDPDQAPTICKSYYQTTLVGRVIVSTFEGHMEVGQRLKALSHRLKKPGIKPETPGLCVFIFNVTLTAKVIWRLGLNLKSHQTGWSNRSPGLQGI